MEISDKQTKPKNVKNIKTKRKAKQNIPYEHPKRKNNAHYSMLTIVLIICIFELTISALQNVNKHVHFTSKIKDLETKRNEEQDRNRQLKDDIKNFDSASTLESIARNNLKMASDDEILIIINKTQPKNEEDIKVSNKLFNIPDKIFPLNRKSE